MRLWRSMALQQMIYWLLFVTSPKKQVAFGKCQKDISRQMAKMLCV